MKEGMKAVQGLLAEWGISNYELASGRHVQINLNKNTGMLVVDVVIPRNPHPLWLADPQ